MIRLLLIITLLLGGCGTSTYIPEQHRTDWNDIGFTRAFTSSPIEVFSRPYSPYDPYQN